MDEEPYVPLVLGHTRTSFALAGLLSLLVLSAASGAVGPIAQPWRTTGEIISGWDWSPHIPPTSSALHPQQPNNPMHIQLGFIDYAILLIYFLFVLGIGWLLKRRMKASTDFLLSGRSIPAWVTGLAFLSANLGAQEVIGMVASGAKYGIMTSHFYWVGAIPAMVFLAIFMMPFYYGSKARSVPEYLKLRFDEKTRGLNAISFAVMTVFSSGISLHALAKLMELLLGWNYDACILISAFIVLVYIFLGGLTSAIYNEVLQFFMIVLGFAPLVFLALKDVGGWSALKEKLIPVATESGFAAGTWTQSWARMGSPAENPMGIGWFGMVMGLGFVLSFGYWCTDFLVVQRAISLVLERGWRDAEAGRQLQSHDSAHDADERVAMHSMGDGVHDFPADRGG